MIDLSIDGKPVSVTEGTTIFDAARALGIEIPALCHDPRLRPVGVCRMCVVDVGGAALAASCVRACENGMEVHTATAEIEAHRATLTELLMADQPAPADDAREQALGDNALFALSRRYDATGAGLPAADTRAAPRPADASSRVISVDHRACILCDRCIRACDEVQNNEVIGRTGKGYATRIAFENPSREIKLGDKVELIITHCDPAVNLYDHYHCIRGDRLEAMWEITGRGKCQ